MTLFADAILAVLSKTAITPQGLLAVVALFAVIGIASLLPQPRGRSILLGWFFSTLALLGAAYFTSYAYGDPTSDTIGNILFWLFSAGSLGFGAVLVAQRNPARGAIAFAFVVMSTCGLFLLLAAPFLMAATVIVYAGAIVVTFLFVLMLSNTAGPSDENDRTRDPMLGSLAGFGFAGLVLFALYQTAAAGAGPSPPLTADDRVRLLAAADALHGAGAATGKEQLIGRAFTAATRDQIATVVGATGTTPTIQERLRFAQAEPRTRGVIAQANALAAKNAATFAALDNNLLGNAPDIESAKRDLAELRGEVLILAGRGDLPARNVANLGMLLYSQHLLAVILAGVLLLVATVGAVAISGRKGAIR